MAAKHKIKWRPCSKGCKGWLHMNSGTATEDVQRCDDCKRFSDDNSAQVAHAAECGCDWGCDIERVIVGADSHGQQTGDADHTIGDLQTALRECWKQMEPSQRRAAQAALVNIEAWGVS